jgi:hypothetical protein
MGALLPRLRAANNGPSPIMPFELEFSAWKFGIISLMEKITKRCTGFMLTFQFPVPFPESLFLASLISRKCSGGSEQRPCICSFASLVQAVL